MRIAEHAGTSFRTGLSLSHPQYSSIREHANICKCTKYICLNNFTVLGTQKNVSDLRIFESIFIHKDRPALNNMKSAIPLHILT